MSSKLSPEQMSPHGRRTYEILAHFTMFPGPMLTTQLKRHDLNEASVDAEGIAAALDDIVAAIERFTSPEKGAMVRQLLTELVEGKDEIVRTYQ